MSLLCKLIIALGVSLVATKICLTNNTKDHSGYERLSIMQNAWDNQELLTGQDVLKCNRGRSGTRAIQHKDVR